MGAGSCSYASPPVVPITKCVRGGAGLPGGGELDSWHRYVRRLIETTMQPPSLSEQRVSPLPPSLPPRGLSRAQAAAYIGVSPSLFDEMVQDGRMPKPTRIW